MTVIKVTNVQYILKKPTLKNSGFFSSGPTLANTDSSESPEKNGILKFNCKTRQQSYVKATY